ncbi:hypothetical protein MKZ38_008188 [Zalerion maritima]|uniref:Uncharacterized protein n=1 Tax=Zalerion maritima TaxID=339359 RepID=A0AAD5RH09_9PEZI|nr:hypothetical protein MKZ38_008188 [Zalerion maritima]
MASPGGLSASTPMTTISASNSPTSPVDQPLVDPDTIYYTSEREIPSYLTDVDSIGALYLVSDALFQWAPDGQGFAWQSRSTGRFLPLPTIKEASREGSPLASPILRANSRRRSRIRDKNMVKRRPTGSPTKDKMGTESNNWMGMGTRKTGITGGKGKYGQLGIAIDLADLHASPPLELPPSPISPGEEELEREFNFDISFSDFSLGTPGNLLNPGSKHPRTRITVRKPADSNRPQSSGSTRRAPFLPPITPPSPTLSLPTPENSPETALDGEEVLHKTLDPSIQPAPTVPIEGSPTPPSAPGTSDHRPLYCLSRDFGRVPQYPKHPKPTVSSIPIVNSDNGNPKYVDSHANGSPTKPEAPVPTSSNLHWYDTPAIGQLPPAGPSTPTCRLARRRDKMLKYRREENVRAWRKECRDKGAKGPSVRGGRNSFVGAKAGAGDVPGPPSSGWKIWEVIREEEHDGENRDGKEKCPEVVGPNSADGIERVATLKDAQRPQRRWAANMRDMIHSPNSNGTTASPLRRAITCTNLALSTSTWYCKRWCFKFCGVSTKASAPNTQSPSKSNNRKGKTPSVVKDRSDEVLNLLIAERSELEEEKEWEQQLQAEREKVGQRRARRKTREEHKTAEGEKTMSGGSGSSPKRSMPKPQREQQL